MQSSKESPSFLLGPQQNDGKIEEFLKREQILLQNGQTHPMFSRHYNNRMWIYLCYPCGATCLSEVFLHSHLKGKKHTFQVLTHSIWPSSIIENHPYFKKRGQQSEPPPIAPALTEIVISPGEPAPPGMEEAEENVTTSILENSLQNHNAPIIGLEYLIEISSSDYDIKEPRYFCSLCMVKGDPRTIIKHIEGFRHRTTYMSLHYPLCYRALQKYQSQKQYHSGVVKVIENICKCIEQAYGRLKPLQVSSEDFDALKPKYIKQITEGKHFSERDGGSFEEMVDEEYIMMISQTTEISSADEDFDSKVKTPYQRGGKEVKSHNTESLLNKPEFQDIQGKSTSKNSKDDSEKRSDIKTSKLKQLNKDKAKKDYKDNPHGEMNINMDANEAFIEKEKWEKYRIKMKEFYENAKKELENYEQFPEKHPSYQKEWKKFWNRKCKEKQAENKNIWDFDLKPEWIQFWSIKMKQLHNESLLEGKNLILKSVGLPADEPPNKDNSSEDSCADLNKKSFVPSSSKNISPEKDHSKDKYPKRRSLKSRERSFTRKSRERNILKSNREKRSLRSHERSPLRRSHDRSPLRRSRERSPLRRSRERSPLRRSRERSPLRDRERVSYRKSRERSPSKRSLDKSYDRFSDRTSSWYSDRNSDRNSHTEKIRDRIRNSDYDRKRDPLKEEKDRDGRYRRQRSPSPRRESKYARSSFESKEAESKRLWRIFDERLDNFLQKYRKKYDEYKTNPMSHPLYYNEWMKFKDNNLGFDEDELSENMKVEWENFWNNKLRDFREEEIKARKSSLMAELGLTPKNEVESIRKFNTNSPVNDDSFESERRKPLQQISEDLNIISVLRHLTALENYLGSLGPRVVELLGVALRMEKEKPNSSESILFNDDHCVFLETVKEKLKGQLLADLIENNAKQATRTAIQYIASLTHKAEKLSAEVPKMSQRMDIDSASSLSGMGGLDKAAIANQIAAALIAQGKTDVTTEELEALINAVVGVGNTSQNMVSKSISSGGLLNHLAEMRKSDLAPGFNKPFNMRSKMNDFSSEAPPIPQNTYSQNKPFESQIEEEPFIDKLTDSELKTLLQNFKDLSSEEQNGLITYLKKLEAKNPLRVEQLRRFIDIGSSASENLNKITVQRGKESSPFSNRMSSGNPSFGNVSKDQSTSYKNVSSLRKESDDEDYSYDDVIKCAAEKVKKNQFEEEMRLITQSIQKSKAETATKVTQSVTNNSLSEKSNNMIEMSDSIRNTKASNDFHHQNSHNSGAAAIKNMFLNQGQQNQGFSNSLLGNEALMQTLANTLYPPMQKEIPSLLSMNIPPSKNEALETDLPKESFDRRHRPPPVSGNTQQQVPQMVQAPNETVMRPQSEQFQSYVSFPKQTFGSQPAPGTMHNARMPQNPRKAQGLLATPGPSMPQSSLLGSVPQQGAGIQGAGSQAPSQGPFHGDNRGMGSNAMKTSPGYGGPFHNNTSDLNERLKNLINNSHLANQFNPNSTNFTSGILRPPWDPQRSQQNPSWPNSAGVGNMARGGMRPPFNIRGRGGGGPKRGGRGGF